VCWRVWAKGGGGGKIVAGDISREDKRRRKVGVIKYRSMNEHLLL